MSQPCEKHSKEVTGMPGLDTKVTCKNVAGNAGPGQTGGPAHSNITQRGQASVTLQPDSGLFNSLGAGVVKLTV